MKKQLEYVVIIILGIVLALSIRFFVIEGYKISGESMAPTFDDGDYVVVEKLSYKIGELEIGDIVIVATDALAEKKIIKRVVGLEGDTLMVKDGVLYRNNEKVKEDYINLGKQEDMGETKIEKGQVYVMGDNRNNSLDSRYLGSFTYEQIKGKVAIEIWNNPFKIY